MINKLKEKIIWVIIVFSVLIILSFGAGFLIKDWPLVQVDREIKITEIIDISFTVLLALLIPLYIKYFIEKGNKVNEMVLDEVKRYRDHLELTHQRFFTIYQSKSINEDNKSELNVYCEILDSKFEVLSTILKERCKEKSENLIEELKNNQIKFWKTLTSIEINSIEVTSIHPITFSKEIKNHQDITETIMKINLLITEY
jgi:hypothetical protein